MDENEFELDGKTYVAKPEVSKLWPCEGCDLDPCGEFGKAGAPECQSSRRCDGINVIFVEKQQ